MPSDIKPGGDPPSLSEPLLHRSSPAPATSPLYRANLFRRLTFSWLNPLLRFGSSKPLDLHDVPSLDAGDGAFSNWRNLAGALPSENLFPVLFRCYSVEILLTGFFILLRTLALVAAPLLLYAFVTYASSGDQRSIATGCWLLAGLILTKIVESFSYRHWFFESRRTGMRMRSAVIAAVVEKQLKLSALGKTKHSVGEVVNYIGVDAYRLGDALSWLHQLWSLPLQLLLAMAVLFWALRLGALPGVVPVLLFGFLNVPFARLLQSFQVEFMAAQDERLRATSEALSNMKIIKLQSWEEQFGAAVAALREKEFRWLKAIQETKAYGSALYWISPTVVSGVMFAGTAWLNSAPLDAATVFTVLATLRVMSEPVRMIPDVLTMVIQVKVSLDRVAAFLLEDEVKESDVKRVNYSGGGVSVAVRDAAFCWAGSENKLTLRPLSFVIPAGTKFGVCGPVGAGKSSLLHALLGEIPRVSGTVEVAGSVAYVAQNAWIQSGTVRDNVVFGKAYDGERYERCIRCCALDKDVASFSHGDLTEIGQRGLNLSGGQKQRLQLARAVYSDADVFLLDDPFSAVDAHTAAILFNDCVMGALKNKTVILVTHQVEFLAQTDRILVMEDGRVVEDGTYTDLMASGAAFRRLVDAHRSAISAFGSSTPLAATVDVKDKPSSQRTEINEWKDNTATAVQLTEEEEKERGNLGFKPYKDYLAVARGAVLFTGLVFSVVAFSGLQITSSYWLAYAVQHPRAVSPLLLVGVYAAISTVCCVLSVVKSLFGVRLGLKASRAFFTGLMDSVFRAPMSFFDSTPIGRIVTRASTDLCTLDFDVPVALTFSVAGAFEAALIIATMVAVTWQVVIVAIPATAMVIYAQMYHLDSARELVRINGTTKAPVMNFAAESALGVVTIRAFRSTERFIRRSLELIDADATLFFHTVATLEWVQLRVEALQSLNVLTFALLLIFLPQGTIAPGIAGLCLSYALVLTSCQVFLTRNYSSLDNYIISAERIKQYMHIAPEPLGIIPGTRPPTAWPPRGKIQLIDLKVRYRQNAPLVLKGISCTIEPAKRIGVVGRTGSGKSTLIAALFRLVDPAEGRIVVDGVDISTIGLKDLRSKLSIIPQEPALFRGTVRSNLDPVGQHGDDEIWEALEKCQLKSTIAALPSLLDASVSDGGENWSVGQRQLFCLGRVLLRKNRILVLDEATASVDSATDAVLQRVIREEFRRCTVITVAHRVPTVTDSDMVMLLSDGRVVEYEEPSKLLEKQQSAFAKLVAEYWANCGPA